MSARWIVILALSLSNDDGGGTTHALSCQTVARGSRGSSRGGGGVPSFATRAGREAKRKQSPGRTNPIRTRAVLASVAPLSSAINAATESTPPEPNHGVQSASKTTATAAADTAAAATTPSPPELCSVDVRYDLRSRLAYDAESGRYLDTAQSDATTVTTPSNVFQKWTQFLHSAFVPEGVSQSYYRFMKWRILQRFVNANVHVIGTQSLLMGLRGMREGGGGGGAPGAAAMGAAAATNWVLKDTLGKVVRMAWASKMGRKFDPDAKRWRFRASLIYALGNGLEVGTYLRPQCFLVLAMLANSCKQMSMLTSSATRNALYNSFRRAEDVSPSSSSSGGAVARGNDAARNSTAAAGGGGNRRGSGGVENIGDITAKGEAQIAVVDLLGIASGIFLSRAVGVSVQNVFAVWVILQIMEIFCMYHEMRAIVYKTFNFERMYTVLGKLLLDEGDADGRAANGESPIAERKFKFTGHIPTPERIAAEEKIFLPPDHLARRAIAFGSPGRTLLDPAELDALINDVFRGEKYFLVVGQDVKNQRGLSARVRQWMRRRRELSGDDPQEQCHIVLHADANNLDILKSALALVVLRKKLVRKANEGTTRDDDDGTAPALRSRDCMDVLREARAEASEIFPEFLRELTKQGWRPPLRSMLGRVSARAEWTIGRRR